MRLQALVGALLFTVACNNGPKHEVQPQVSDNAKPAATELPDPQVAVKSNEPEQLTAKLAKPQSQSKPKPAAAAKPPAPIRSAATEQRAAEKNVNPDALVLADFKHRIDEYMKIHKQAAGDAPKQKETHDPAKIEASEKAVAANIRELRANAKPGEIFTPEIRNAFQRLMYPQVVGTTGREVREELNEDAGGEGDEGKQKPVPLKVNASYPEGNALPTVPANVLLNLPKLPEELEYRVIKKNLILRDVQANIIVDYIPNVIR